MNINTLRKNALPLTILFYIGFALIFGKLLIMHGPSFPIISDSLKYIEIAESITHGNYTAIEGIVYPPGYPAFLASIYTLLNPYPETVFAMHFVFLAGIASLLFLLAYRHFRMSYYISALVGFGILVWPYMILYSLLIMSEVVYTFFLLAAVYALLEACTQKQKKYFVGAGIMIGITTLIRPVTLLLPFWLIGFVILGYILHKKLTPSYKNIGIGILFFFITLLPWSIYMYSETGTMLPVSSHLPYVLDKSYNTLSYEEEFQTQKATPAFIDIIKSKSKNFIVFWNPGAEGYQAEQVTSKFPAAHYLIQIYKIGFFSILFLAFASFITTHRMSLYIVWATILYVWLLHTMLFPYPRYMLPLVPFVLLLAGYTIDNHAVVYKRIKSFL